MRYETRTSWFCSKVVIKTAFDVGKSASANNKQKPQQNESKINVKHVWTYVRVTTSDACLTVAHRSICKHAQYLSHVTYHTKFYCGALKCIKFVNLSPYSQT